MRTKFKKWAVDYLDESFTNQIKLNNFNKEEFLKFAGKSPLFLEIGPGKGQFITSLASKYLDYKFIVCELNATISGICLKKIDDSQLTNVKLVAHNFFELGKIFLENNIFFDGIILNFSDPWPKKRHERRRLTSDIFLLEYASLLKKDGQIYFKSDNDDFSLYSLEQFKKFKFDVIKECFDYNVLDDFDALTEFETKFKNNGVKIKRFIFKNNPNVIKKSEELI